VVPIASAIESVLIEGDLKKLTPEQRVSYYNAVCKSLGLNPLTQPFNYIVLNNKLTLYAKKDCTDQLRKLHDISVLIPAREVIEGVYVVTARATIPGGRTDESTGAVAIDGLKGESRANAMMKAETKSKRRVTLSICGLGMLDETEAEPLADPEPRVFLRARVIKVDKREYKATSWADVTFVTEDGEEITLPTAVDVQEAAISLFEQITPEELVTLRTDVGAKNRKERIVKVEREKKLEPPAATINGVVDLV
jgi:hypothetical protein